MNQDIPTHFDYARIKLKGVWFNFEISNNTPDDIFFWDGKRYYLSNWLGFIMPTLMDPNDNFTKADKLILNVDTFYQFRNKVLLYIQAEDYGDSDF